MMAGIEPPEPESSSVPLDAAEPVPSGAEAHSSRFSRYLKFARRESRAARASQAATSPSGPEQPDVPAADPGAT